MPRVEDRVFQTSDLAGAGRTHFIESARHDRARLRTKDGEQLIMLRETALDCLTELRRHALNYFMLDSALMRETDARRPGDFGEWAFIALFNDNDQHEFRDEVNEALIVATSTNDLSGLARVLDDWRRSARTLSDPIARAILDGADSESWEELERPNDEG